MTEAPNKPAATSPAHSNLVLGIVMLGTLMGALDSTIVLLAFPVINDSLHSDLRLRSGLFSLTSCPCSCHHTDGQNRRHLRTKQNIQFRLRDFHRWLSTLRFLTAHLSADSFPSPSSGRRGHHAGNQRSNNSRLFSQAKNAAEPTATTRLVSQQAHCLA